MPSRRSSCLSALFGMSYSGGKIFGKWRCDNRILVIMTGGPAVIPSGVIEKEADMSICPEGYMPRVVDAEVQECLAIYGAVEICGAKWCGKTWTSMRHGESIVHIDEGQNLAMAQADPPGLPSQVRSLTSSTSGSSLRGYGTPYGTPWMTLAAGGGSGSSRG